MAISTKVDKAHQICDFTAFSLLSRNFLVLRCCLIHLKNNGRSIDGCRIMSPSILIGFFAHHDRSARLIQSIEMCEVQIAAIHDIERTGFDQHEVQHIDFVHLAVADVNKLRELRSARRRYSSSRVLPSPCRFRTCTRDELALQRGVRPNAPISRFVGIGQCRAMNAVKQVHRIKFVRFSTKHPLDVAKTLAPWKLGKRNHAKLLRESHATKARIVTGAIDDGTKTCLWHELQNLCEKYLADIYEKSSQS
jgi:hypothetical protein